MIKAFILFLLPLISSFADIHTTRELQDLFIYVEEDTWVLFDIDDTLIEPSTQVGRAEWFYRQTERLMLEGMSKEAAVLAFYPEWIQVQKKIPIRFVDPNTLHVVKELESKQVTNFAITHRHTSIREVTLSQLESLEIDFSSSSPMKEEMYFPTVHPSMFSHGVLFVCDFNEKGPLFEMFLHLAANKPKKIILIDDKRKNLESFQNSLSGSNIDFVGLHFVRADDRKYDSDLAEEERSNLDL